MKQIYNFYFLVFPLFIFCAKEPTPKSVPSEARFDKSRQVYFYNKDGNNFAYYKNGQLYYKCLKQKKNVQFCYYFSQESQKIGSGELVNDFKNGIWKWNFLDGKLFLKQDHSYKNKREFWISTNSVGNENGKFERFYPDGKIDLVGFYEFGYKNGAWKKFFPNGKIEFEGKYKKDKKIKKWKYFYPSGQIEAEEFFDKKGELISRKTFKPNGDLVCRIFPKKFQCEETFTK